VQKSLPRVIEFGLIDWIAEELATVMSRPVDVISDALRNPDLCNDGSDTEAKAIVATATQVPLDANGVPVSENDLWNKCIRGERIYLDDVRNNKDSAPMGKTRLRNLPDDCASYHTGNNWIFPDLNIHFTWEAAKKLASFPEGYVGVKQKTVAAK